MARILYLHQYFRTPEEGGAIRSWYISQALKEAGHEVVVISAHNSPKEEVRRIDGLTVYYLPVFYENNLKKFGRIFSFLKFIKRSIHKSVELHREKHFDICYATSTPLTIGITAMWLKLRFGIPYIFEVRDLWPEAPIQMGVIKSGFWKWVLRKLEFRIYKKASSIVALSPGMKEGILNVIPGREVHLIPNMSDTTFFSAKNKEPGTPLQIFYAGSIGKANHLEYLVEAAHHVKEQNLPVKFLIAGQGSEKVKIRKLVAALELKNIEIISSVNKEQIKSLLEESDFVYISFLNIPILQTNSPNKFFDAIAAGKPCITNIEGWIADEIREQQIGIAYNPLQPDLLADFLRKAFADSSIIKNMSERARKLAETKYDRKHLCAKIVEIVEQTVK